MTAAWTPEGRQAGRVCVVTGAARGLGLAMAERLRAEGGIVAHWDLDGGQLDTVAGAPGFTGLIDTVDVSDSAQVDAAMARVRRELGPVHVLINNAGIAEPCDPWDVTDESWHRMMSINSDGAFWCIRAALPDMRAARSGKIISISSIAALHGRPTTHPAYATSKASLIGMTVSLAHNLAPFGICVNAICPSFIASEIHRSYPPDQLAQFSADIRLRPPGRGDERGRPADIAATAAFLASPDADFITGQYIEVNGGARP